MFSCPAAVAPAARHEQMRAELSKLPKPLSEISCETLIKYTGGWQPQSHPLTGVARCRKANIAFDLFSDLGHASFHLFASEPATLVVFAIPLVDQEYSTLLVPLSGVILSTRSPYVYLHEPPLLGEDVSPITVTPCRRCERKDEAMRSIQLRLHTYAVRDIRWRDN